MSLNALFKSRLVFLYIFLACTAMMGIGFYFEHVEGLEPCPLCMTQRVFIVLTGLIGLLACLHNPATGSYKAYGITTTLSAVIGGGFSSRQLWLQSLPPDQVPACGPSFSYVLETFPFSETLKLMLTGDGNCAEVVWRFLGLSIPGWTLVAFCLFATLGIWQAFRK